VDETALVDVLLQVKRQTERFSYQRLAANDPSFPNVAIFKTLLNPRLDLVRPVGERFGDRDAFEFWPQTTPEEVFDAADGQLLVVGEPGSGKTMLLCELVRHVVNTRPALTPVLLNLSAWSGQATFQDFVLGQLTNPASGGMLTRQQAELALHRQLLALFLDGLDEVGEHYGNDVIDELRDFMPGWRAPVVVTCQTTAFEKLGSLAPLKTGGGVAPLSDETIRAVAFSLDAAAGWASIADGTSMVVDWMRFPLYLTTAIRSGINPTDVEIGADGRPLPALFDRFIKTRLTSHIAKTSPGYNVEQAQNWLSYIGAYMLNQHEPIKGLKPSTDTAVFNLSNLTPEYPTRAQRLAGGLAFALIGGLSGSLVGGLVFCLYQGLIVGVVSGLSPSARPTWTQFKRPSLKDLAAWLAIWLVIGLAPGFIVGLIGGLILGLTFGLVLGAIVGLVSGLVIGVLKSSVVKEGTRPDDAMKCSMRSWIIYGLAGGLVGGFAFLVDGLVVGLVVGLGCGLGKGGWFVVLQRRLRRRVSKQKLLPGSRNLESFVLAMDDVGILRRVNGGSSVRFTHDLVQRQLANPTTVRIPDPQDGDVAIDIATVQ
jgi:hypothetical protein